MSNPEVDWKSFKPDSAALPFETQEEWMKFFEQFGANGRTFQDFTNLSPQSMEVMYMVGFNSYNAGKYENAERVFQFLAYLNHFERKYWKGLAASRENQGKYKEALEAYGYMGMLDVEDPFPPFQAGKCLLASKRTEEAKTALRAAAYNSTNKPEHSGLKQEAEHLLAALEKSSNGQN